jgi:hypothetical protein
VQFADMLEVHNIRHYLCMARGGLLKDSEALSAIAIATKDRLSTIDTAQVPSAASLVSMAGQFDRDLCSEVTRTDNILRRLDGAANLVRPLQRQDLAPQQLTMHARLGRRWISTQLLQRRSAQGNPSK